MYDTLLNLRRDIKNISQNNYAAYTAGSPVGLVPL